MPGIGEEIQKAISALASSSEQARINLRAHQVRDRYRSALESVYGDQAKQFLAHTNNVYIMNKQDVKTLIVYVDESIYAAELNAQRELIKLKLLELFGEDIEAFEILVSRGSYKNNHPYSEDLQRESEEAHKSLPDVPLSSDEKSFVSDTVSRVSDKDLAEVLEKAMTSNMAWLKAEKAQNSAKDIK